MSDAHAPGANGTEPAVDLDPHARVGTGLYHGQPRGEVLERVPMTTKRLLDVGCANGAFGVSVKEALGAVVWGIEIHEPVARVAQKRLDKVLIGDALACLAEVPLASFDCITFNDVLEHLTDPETLLRAASKHLAPGGVVIASIPNIRHWEVVRDLVLKGNFDYADSGILDRTHLRFFTLKSIHKLFATTGYRLRKVEGINGPVTPNGRRFAKLLPSAFSDMQYIQFLCTAEPA
jgi:2-polyprenyl-3-methyl-5-hydroxy-6-metoxy-1,4-benzoquinol methylase